MQNYNNVIIISADRNGSTAFQHQLLRQQPYNDPFENYNIDGINPNKYWNG